MTTTERFVIRWLWAVLVLFVTTVKGIDADGRSIYTTQPPPGGVNASRLYTLRPGDPRAHGVTDSELNALRALLRKGVKEHIAPGVSLLIAHKGEVIFKEAFGNLSIDQKVLMASSAKPVTATLLLILADQKKLALDDPIEKYLPEFKGIKLNGRQPARRATVRQLLCNMSGLPGDFLAISLLRRLRNGVAEKQAPTQRNNDRNARDSLPLKLRRSLAESVRTAARGGLATEPGAEFHYCTMGFNVAARVAEAAAKQPFEELIRSELLQPMGMNSTRYTPIGLEGLGSSPILPNGESRLIMAGGGMTSTLDDFAAFYQMHLNGGSYRGKHIVSEQAASATHTRQAKLELLMAGPYGNNYGLAFFLDRLDDRGQARVITHPGLFGTTPWLDKDRELVGVLFVQSNFLRTMSWVREIQAKVHAMLPPLTRTRQAAGG
jgi:CubicO group peptidase (beta-lactamase class C family)